MTNLLEAATQGPLTVPFSSNQRQIKDFTLASAAPFAETDDAGLLFRYSSSNDLP